jgi:hypothetical protein
MVSSAVGMTLKELLQTLKRIRKEHGDTPEYKRLRGKLPKIWPM